MKPKMTNEEFLKEYSKLYDVTWHQGEEIIYTKDKVTYYKNYENEIDGEKWKSLSHIKVYTKYSVSNFGRVKFNGHILPQGDDVKQGYLKIDPKKQYRVNHGINVYTLVACGFLGKTIGDGYDVHHIDNNGYNCTVENLVLLTRAQHKAVHYKTKMNKDELKRFLEK